MTCMCGDSQCPSCGLAQGTLETEDLCPVCLEPLGEVSGCCDNQDCTECPANNTEDGA